MQRRSDRFADSAMGIRAMWRLAPSIAAILSVGAALSAPGAPPGLRMPGPCGPGILEPCSAYGGQRHGELRALVLRGGEGWHAEGPPPVSEPAVLSSSPLTSESDHELEQSTETSDPRIEELKIEDPGVGKEEEMLDREAAAEAGDPEDAILDATARLWVATKEVAALEPSAKERLSHPKPLTLTTQG